MPDTQATTAAAAGDTPSGGGHLPSCLPDISVSSAPLPLLSGEAAERVRQDAGALMLVLCMTMAASVLSASFVVFLVRCDRVSKVYSVCLWLQDMIGI
jgi:hypothetical protein